MRRIEFSGRHEEASRGVRGELLNRGSGVRVPAPAPVVLHHCPVSGHRARSWQDIVRRPAAAERHLDLAASLGCGSAAAGLVAWFKPRRLAFAGVSGPSPFGLNR